MIRNLEKLAIPLLLFALALTAFAQSGRIKKPGDPKPTPTRRPQLELPPEVIVKPTPASLPAKTNDDDDDDEGVLSVESVLIPIPVSVTDLRGTVVEDLKLQDFELRVDGEVQEITEISRSDTPIRLALLFDNSSSVAVAREFEKKAATKFLKRVLRPSKDQAALYSVATVTRQEQRLTSDTRQLIQAIEMFPQPEGATALLDGIVSAANYLREFAHDGRRVIVIVSDGVDTVSDILLENKGFEKVIREAQIANCQIYVVKTTDFENYQRTGVRGGSANLDDPVARRRMQELAAQTGGAVYSPLDERELDAAFNQIAAELSQQYILSYYPNETKADGRFRQISLNIPARKNLTVRTRKGYYLPKM